MSSKPNIVYFVADQMRADVLAHLGNPASVTPNLDALVQEACHSATRIVRILFACPAGAAF